MSTEDKRSHDTGEIKVKPELTHEDGPVIEREINEIEQVLMAGPPRTLRAQTDRYQIDIIRRLTHAGQPRPELYTYCRVHEPHPLVFVYEQAVEEPLTEAAWQTAEASALAFLCPLCADFPFRPPGIVLRDVIRSDR